MSDSSKPSGSINSISHPSTEEVAPDDDNALLDKEERDVRGVREDRDDKDSTSESPFIEPSIAEVQVHCHFQLNFRLEFFYLVLNFLFI